MYDDTMTVDKAFYNKLKAQTTWLSVKDRLPDVGVPVLLWNANGFAYVDTWSKFGCWTITPTTGEVTHWMPLPEPPESEGEYHEKVQGIHQV